MSTHVDLATPCGEGQWSPERVCRDLGLPAGTPLVSVCGRHCSNPQHALSGTRQQAQTLRLEHLLTGERTRHLSLRELAARAGCSHGTVATHKRRTQKVLDYTNDPETKNLQEQEQMCEEQIQTAFCVSLSQDGVKWNDQVPNEFGRADVVTEDTVWEVKVGPLDLKSFCLAQQQAARYALSLGKSYTGVVTTSIVPQDRARVRELFPETQVVEVGEGQRARTQPRADTSETDELLNEYLERTKTGNKVGNKFRIQVLNAVVSDPRFMNWSDQHLATKLACTAPTIAAARKRVGVVPTERVGADGVLKKKPEKTGFEIQRALKELLGSEETLELSSREVACIVGCSHAAVLKYRRKNRECYVPHN